MLDNTPTQSTDGKKSSTSTPNTTPSATNNQEGTSTPSTATNKPKGKQPQPQTQPQNPNPQGKPRKGTPNTTPPATNEPKGTPTSTPSTQKPTNTQNQAKPSKNSPKFDDDDPNNPVYTTKGVKNKQKATNALSITKKTFKIVGKVINKTLSWTGLITYTGINLTFATVKSALFLAIGKLKHIGTTYKEFGQKTTRFWNRFIMHKDDIAKLTTPKCCDILDEEFANLKGSKDSKKSKGSKGSENPKYSKNSKGSKTAKESENSKSSSLPGKIWKGTVLASLGLVDLTQFLSGCIVAGIDYLRYPLSSKATKEEIKSFQKIMFGKRAGDEKEKGNENENTSDAKNNTANTANPNGASLKEAQAAFNNASHKAQNAAGNAQKAWRKQPKGRQFLGFSLGK